MGSTIQSRLYGLLTGQQDAFKEHLCHNADTYTVWSVELASDAVFSHHRDAADYSNWTRITTKLYVFYACGCKTCRQPETIILPMLRFVIRRLVSRPNDAELSDRWRSYLKSCLESIVDYASNNDNRPIHNSGQYKSYQNNRL